jgi:cytoskeleton protein RodZ
VDSANGDRSQNRRKKRRREPSLTPAAAGAILREERERLGIELAEVHDRTGISWRNLEAIESGEVQHFSEPSAAAVAMRRYSELVGLDPDPLIASLSSPVMALAGAPSVGTGPSRGLAPAPEEAGHLRRYYGDHSHLNSFTQTAQVPAVGGLVGSQGAPYGGTPSAGGSYQPPRRRRKAPLGLRLLTWLVLFLLLVGAAGLGVDHYKPQWLRDIHVIKSTAHLASPPTTSHTKVIPPTTQPTAPVITAQATGVGTTAVKVDASSYSIVVSTFNYCWVEAQTPLNANPLIDKTLQPGQTASIPVTGDPVTLELGSLAALIKVEVNGQVVTGWSLRPNAVPFQVDFTSS